MAEPSTAAQPGQAHDELKRQLTTRLKDYTEVSPDKIIFTDDEADLERRLFAKNQIKAEYIVERRTGGRRRHLPALWVTTEAQFTP